MGKVKEILKKNLDGAILEVYKNSKECCNANNLSIDMLFLLSR